MKTLTTLVLTTAALGWAATAAAAPVLYRVTGVHTLELDHARNPVDSANYLLPDGTPITMAFIYDPDLPVPLSDPATYDTRGLPGSYVTGPLKLRNIARDNQVAFGTVGTSYNFNSIFMGGWFANEATLAPGQTFDAMWAYDTNHWGFSIGDFTSIQMQYYNMQAGDGVSNALPRELVGGEQSHIRMLFARYDQNGAFIESRSLIFATEITSVPIPAAAWLFGTGLLGLAAGSSARRRRR